MLPRRKLKRNIRKQVGAELGKAQPKLGLGRIKIFLALAKSRSYKNVKSSCNKIICLVPSHFGSQLVGLIERN